MKLSPLEPGSSQPVASVAVPGTSSTAYFAIFAFASVSVIVDALPSRGPAVGNAMAGFVVSTFVPALRGQAGMGHRGGGGVAGIVLDRRVRGQREAARGDADAVGVVVAGLNGVIERLGLGALARSW